MNEPSIIKIRNFSVYFNSERTMVGLSNINLDIPRGQILALIGASGSGKSLTSLALMGLLPTDAIQEGSIEFNQNDLLKLKEKEWNEIRGNEISMIFQEPMSALNPLITCGEQLLENILIHQKISKNSAKKLALEWLDKVKIPNPHSAFEKYPHQMSGGQKQRIMIAMAMVNNPKLLIADEPTTALDVLVQKDIIELIRDLQKQTGTTILFITHDLALAQLLTDQFVELRNGKIVERSLKNSGSQYKQIEKGFENNPLLEILNVSVQYKNRKETINAVQNVNLKIHKGEVIGLIGGSGCGKTTLSKAILGIEKISDGEIRFDGERIDQLKGEKWRRLRKNLQIIYQDPFSSLNPRIKIGNALMEPIILHQKCSFVEAKKRAIKWLENVQLKASDFDKYPHQFSGGQRQRICIARALCVEPSLVICDESVAALDINVQGQILELLLSLQQTYRLTLLFITHDINVVKKIADRIVVMENGNIVEEGNVRDVIETPQKEYTQKLINAVP